MNECNVNNGYCAQSCTNTIGSYSCSCLNGFLLISDNRTCNGEQETTYKLIKTLTLKWILMSASLTMETVLKFAPTPLEVFHVPALSVMI